MCDVSSTFLSDESGISGSADRIVFVSQKEEIARLFEDQENWTIQGAQTGISGAAVPRGGGICNCSKWSGVLRTGTDGDLHYMDVLPGTTLKEVKKAVPEGFFFPVDPTEDGATIGGMLATNAAGPCAFYFGKMSDWVLECDVFSPSLGWLTAKRGEYLFSARGELKLPGDVCLRTEPVSEEKSVQQFVPEPDMDLLDLLAGSEGMAGVFGRIRLKLERQFQERWSILCFFDSDNDAFDFSEGIKKMFGQTENCHLLALDFLGKRAVVNYRKFSQDITAYQDIPEISKDLAAVMVEFASEDSAVIEELIGDMFALIEECGGNDENTWAGDVEEEWEKIRKFRHAVSECMNHRIMENKSRCPSVAKLSVDAACKALNLRDMCACLDQITNDMEHAVIIHAGTGIYHIDLFPETEHEWIRAVEIRERIYDLFIEKGGVLAAENGVGKGKFPYLHRLISQKQKAVMERVKLFFDKDCQCNPGNSIF